MRLLNCRTLKLESFNDDAPRYAILSHRWREEEILFDDFQPDGPADRKAGHRSLCKEARDKEGYQKLHMACAQAVNDWLNYVWIDTCCIEKSSSAELSEAINSMFAWYSGADVCYAYLFDVPDHSGTDATGPLGRSQWFRRGWTLQELIAPQKMAFYSEGWVEIGPKLTLKSVLASITGIDADVLAGTKPVMSCSIAMRMSWAAKRETTRKEDEAYCLMGLFDINMPMLYGEGGKAFIRLQEEIMKNTEDESIFAWIDKDSTDDATHGLIARSPAYFADSSGIKPYNSDGLRQVFTKTNRGMHVTLPAVRRWYSVWEASFLCSSPPDYTGVVTVFLKQLTTENEGPGAATINPRDGLFTRIRANKWSRWPFDSGKNDRKGLMSFYVPQDHTPYDKAFTDQVIGLQRGLGGKWGMQDVWVNPKSKANWRKSRSPALGMWMRRAWYDEFWVDMRKGELLLVVPILREWKTDKLAILLGPLSENGQPGVGVDVVTDWNESMDLEALQSLFEPNATSVDMDFVDEAVKVRVFHRIRGTECCFKAVIEVTEKPNIAIS
ncbi:Vegetative incompatibility protein HET-E-1 [Diplodia seriata]|uniref:Vegetative incompatibility protein HET-E-1 n=1 Tax=Diplodia seriata TaxID=420778 RepID=A0A1S8BAK5_9PEZI|nr:Vegetative incompatibility protein HET-E-1 [Diplodia seriata]